jgi:hypothetical protein
MCATAPPHSEELLADNCFGSEVQTLARKTLANDDAMMTLT